MSAGDRRPLAALVLVGFLAAVGVFVLLGERGQVADTVAPVGRLGPAVDPSLELPAPETSPHVAVVSADELPGPEAGAPQVRRRIMGGERFEDPVDPADPVNAETGVRGRVCDATGQGVPGAKVQLRGTKPGGMRMIAVRRGGAASPDVQIAGETRSAHAISDDEGRFEVLGLSARHRYTLHVDPPEGFLKTQVPAPALQERQVVEAGDVTLPRPGSLAGVVRGPDGEPVPGVRVVLGEERGIMMMGGDVDEDVDVDDEADVAEGEQPTERRVVSMSFSTGGGAVGPGRGLPDFGAVQSVTSDASGHFLFEQVSPGQHVVTARQKGLRRARREGVEVAEGRRTEGVVLELRAGLALELLVHDATGQAVVGAQVMLFGGGPGQEQRAETDARGIALLEGLPGPEVFLHVQAEGFAAYDGQLALDPEHDGPERQVAVLRPGTALSGRVVRERDGEPVTQGFVFAEPVVHGGEVRMIATGDDGQLDDEGRFVLSGLLPGRYRLRAQGPGFAAATLEVEVVEGQPGLDVGELRAGELGSLEVTVLDPQGAPVEGAEVELGRGGMGGDGAMAKMVFVQTADEEEVVGGGDDDEEMAPTFMGFGNRATSDPSGVATLASLQPGQVDLRASKAGFAPAYASQVSVSDDGTPSRVTVSLSLGGQVSGRLIRAGEPLAGVSVQLLRDGRGAPADEAITDEGGAFAFERVTAGRYRLRTPGVKLKADPAPFQVEEGRGSQHSLAASHTVALEGSVVDATGGALAGIKLALGHANSFGPGDPAVEWALAETTTGQGGRYRFDDLQPGGSGLWITATLPRGGRATYRVSVPAEGVGQLDLTVPGERAGVEVGCLVWDEARNAAGVGVPVELESLGAGPALRRTSQAGADGRLAFAGIPPGRYRLTVAEGSHARSQAEVEVGDAPVSGPTLVLRPGVTLTLSVRGRSGDSQRVLLQLHDDDAGDPRFAVTHLGDPAIFAGLTPGKTYRLETRASGYQTWEGPLSADAGEVAVQLVPE